MIDYKNASIHQMNQVSLSSRCRYLAWGVLLILIGFCIIWEIQLDPLPTRIYGLGALKVIPLLLCIKPVYRGDVYGYQWVSMLSVLYIMEGAVRAISSPSIISRYMGGTELFLSLLFFILCLLYVYPAKKAAKEIKKRGL